MPADVTEGALPTGWAWACVDEVTELCRYGSSAKTNESGQGIPVLRMGNIQSGSLDFTDLKYLPENHSEFPDLLLQSGDLLFNRTNSFELVGKSAVYTGHPAPCSYASYLVSLRLREACDSKYLCFYLNSHHGRTWVKSVVSQQVGQANVNSTKLRALRFPLPPLAEQRRIVAKVEELFSDLDAGVAAMERARANLKRYRASVLRAAVEGRLSSAWRAAHPTAEPARELLARVRAERRAKWEADQRAKFDVANKTPPKGWQQKYAEPAAPDTANLPQLPEGWCWATVDHSTEIIDYRGRTPPYSDAGIPHLRSQNVKHGQVVWEGLAFVSESTFAEYMTRGLPKAGDVLFTTEAPLGEAALAPTSRFSLAQRLMLLRPHSTLLDAHFLMWQLMAPEFQARLGLSQTGSTVGGISSRNFKPLPLRLPPLAEQEYIVSEVEARLSVASATERLLDANLARAARLRQAILKRAFAGALVPQDPTDEPANALLARLRTEETPVVKTRTVRQNTTSTKRKGGAS